MKFQSTRPIRGATPLSASCGRRTPISIHAPHTGRDRGDLSRLSYQALFQSTRPIRGATISSGTTPSANLFQSTRPIRGATRIERKIAKLEPDFNPRAPYGARRAVGQHLLWRCQISIHAPHTGRDAIATQTVAANQFQSTRPIRGATALVSRWGEVSVYFNPRAPYGARLNADRFVAFYEQFQSTRPIRGATQEPCAGKCRHCDFNPRAPYGARRTTTCSKTRPPAFQSTRPIRGATASLHASANAMSVFQSTRPIRGATAMCRLLHKSSGISIHAPHTGRDFVIDIPAAALLKISIHAPHTGRDIPAPASNFCFTYFNPRAPYGARRRDRQDLRGHAQISIHAPHTGRDFVAQGYEEDLADISIHAPHTGRDSKNA